MKFLVPLSLVQLTTVQRDVSIPSPSLAMKIWNTTDSKEQIWDGSVWRNLSLFDEATTLVKSSFSGFAQGGLIPSSKIALHIFDVQTTFPVNVPGSSFYADSEPSDNVNITLMREIPGNAAVQIGTLQFTTGNKTGSIVFNVQITMNVGDIIFLLSPAVSNSLGNIFFNVVGSSLIPTY